MSTAPKSGEQNEIKRDFDGSTKNIQSIPPTPTKQEDNKAGEQAAQTSGEESVIAPTKNSSRWTKLLQKLRSTGQTSKELKPKAPDATPTKTTPSFPNPAPRDSLVHWIEAAISHIIKEAKDLKTYNHRLDVELEKIKRVYENLKKDPDDDSVKQLDKFRKALMKVSLTIPSKDKMQGENKNDPDKGLGFISEAEQSICGDKSVKMPQLHKRDVFETSTEFKDFEARYMELEDQVKLCLLCFSIFPQEAIIKRRLMVQWWVVEGYASTKKEAVHNFKELMKKGFIHPVNYNRSLSVGSCQVHPFHRSALVELAERAKLFNFESESGDPTQNFSGTFQACLMGAGLIEYEDFKQKNKDENGDSAKAMKELVQELDKLHLLMNVDEHILEFVDEWFSKMRNLNFLYLGRWKALATHHIEVEDPKFLKELEKMKYVKFLSLQGVSNIISLPRSILKLTNLEILDLRACSNLESIPKGIGGCLKMLTHLDMSECYLLAHMPKSISQLKELKVLKGFFISEGDSSSECTLADLQELKYLEKLCIYTDREDFPEEPHVKALEQLTSLIKLTITWGVIHKKESNESASEKKKGPSAPSPSPSPSALSGKLPDNESASEKEKRPPAPSPSGKLPRKLKKLDLKCFPKSSTPEWLKLDNLKEIELKKLYIRGGQFRDLGQNRGSDEKKWKVEVLRLKYLGGIEMEWRQLHDLFPKLKYLEKVSCPNLTLFPCDAKGVWINPH